MKPLGSHQLHYYFTLKMKYKLYQDSIDDTILFAYTLS